MELMSLNPKLSESNNDGVLQFVCDCPLCNEKSCIIIYVRTSKELYPVLIPHHKMKGKLSNTTITPNIKFFHFNKEKECGGNISIIDGQIYFN